MQLGMIRAELQRVGTDGTETEHLYPQRLSPNWRLNLSSACSEAALRRCWCRSWKPCFMLRGANWMDINREQIAVQRLRGRG